MKIKYFCLIILLFVSCSHNFEISRFVKRQVGKTIFINDKRIATIDLTRIDSLKESSDFLMITTVRQNACASCYYSLLMDFDSFIDSCHLNKMNCIVFVHENYDEFIQLLNKYELSHIFIINDPEDSYANDNKLTRYTADYRTFLVDKNMKIRLVGNPLVNNRIRSLYEKEIVEICSQNQ